jgi:hypothetical protein
MNFKGSSPEDLMSLLKENASKAINNKNLVEKLLGRVTSKSYFTNLTHEQKMEVIGLAMANQRLGQQFWIEVMKATAKNENELNKIIINGLLINNQSMPEEITEIAQQKVITCNENPKLNAIFEVLDSGLVKDEETDDE